MAYPDLYRRSILFEILSVNKAGIPISTLESLAFTLPPSSIEIIQKQRIISTPTPGGFFVDNYGLGGANITISGETGNNEKRLAILGKGKTPRYLTGQDAWFEFRDRIQRYSQNNENYVMRFYDLTHKNSKSLFRTNLFDRSSKYSEAWEVVLGDSGSRRTSSKPFFYPYTINLTGLRPLGTYNSSLSGNVISKISNIVNTIDSVVEAIDGLRASIDYFFQNNFEFIEEITSVLSSVTNFEKSLSSFTGLFLEYENKLGGLFGSIINETEEFLTAGVQIIKFPFDALDSARSELSNLRQDVESLITSAKSAGKDLIDPYNWDETIDPISGISLSMTEVEVPFNSIILASKQNSSDEPIGAVSISGIVTPVYSLTPIPITDNTTLEKLATDFFGDPDFKDVIAGTNDIYSNDELVVGDQIIIPVLEPQARLSNNAVYNIPEENSDILGRDASVDETGAFETDASDYLVTTGDQTINQAIGFRLAEKKGRQLRDGSYGIISQIGSALGDDSPFEYLGISIAETLVQDPRIIDVYGLNFYGDDDKIYLSFSYDTLTQESAVYKEGLT